MLVKPRSDNGRDLHRWSPAGYGWFVAMVIVLRLLVEPAGEARAQAGFSAVYDLSDAESDAKKPSVTSTQAQTSLWRQFRQEWENLRGQLSDRGVQFAIRYDGEGFADVSGGLRRGGTYLGNLNLQLTLDAQRLIGWPGATVFLYD